MRTTVRVALFASLAAALGFLLAPLPNIELLTFTLFLGGFLLGVRSGVAAALLATLLYFGLNPYGSSLIFPPLFAMQILAGILVALLGALFARFFPHVSGMRRVTLLPFAALSALIFPVLPLAVWPLLGQGSWQVWLTAAAAMTTWGLIFNLVVFMSSFEAIVAQAGRQGWCR